MITKFKIFESWDDKLGYYVILCDVNRKYSEFLKNNIGLITKIYYPGTWFDVKFDNVPTELKYLNDINFNTVNIEHISKDKKELESILDSRKYNL